MNKMSKRFLASLLIGSMCVSLAGCKPSSLLAAAIDQDTAASASGEASSEYPVKVIRITEEETETEPVTEEKRTIDDVYANIDTYPADLITQLEENEELLEFVLDYPEKKDEPCATRLDETITKGEIPVLIQWDERWGYGLYGDTMLAINGCGPTCLAMVAAGLTGRNDITPLKIAQYSAGIGYLTETADTSWELMSVGCREFGITGTKIDLSESQIIQSLKDGSAIICSVRPGDFTNGGHFIVLTKYQNGEFTVHDPNSKIRSGQTWSYEELAGQIKGLWCYSVVE